MADVRVNYIEASACPGSHLWAAIAGAVKLAIEQRTVVHLTHNNRRYTVDPDKVVDMIAGQYPEEPS